MLYRRLLAGLLVCGVGIFAGCGAEAPPATPKAGTTPKETPHDDHPEHAAHGEGPHGGTIADWGGGKYHVEFTVDHDKKETVIYVLGSDEKTPTPIKAEKIMLTIHDPASEIEAVAQPLEGEAAGMSSRFIGTHDTLGIVKEYAGMITGEVDGTPYTGDFKEVAHDH